MTSCYEISACSLILKLDSNSELNGIYKRTPQSLDCHSSLGKTDEREGALSPGPGF